MMAVMGVGTMLMKGNVAKFALALRLPSGWRTSFVQGILRTLQCSSRKSPEFRGRSDSQVRQAIFSHCLPALLSETSSPRYQSDEGIDEPELYVKTAIVIMGCALGVKAAQQLSLASNSFRGLCAILEAYLIYWALVYWMARKYFKFSREWAAPLASGISICGVSAAIANRGAIRARPLFPIMVSSLVVIFAVVELVVLPFAAREFLCRSRSCRRKDGASRKTDGAAVTSGAMTDGLIRGKALAEAASTMSTDGSP